METARSRFLRYVTYYTTSDEHTGTSPSTERQKDLGRVLLAELTALGLTGARMDDAGNVIATLPASEGVTAPVLALIAHMDTSPDAPGENVQPRVVLYQGGDLPLSDTVSLTESLCPGLSAIAPEETDVIVIAGMGGETIITILQDAPWTADGRHTLLLQPMTKAADLRHWLADNGYTFTEEHLVEDKGRLYPVLTVTGGTHRALTEAEALCGVLLEGDPLYGACLSEHAAKLRRSAEGLRRSSAPDAAAQAARMDALAEELERKRCKV